MTHPPIKPVVLLLLLTSFASAYSSSANFATEAVSLDSGGAISGSSANFAMDSAAGLMAGYVNSANFATLLGIYFLPSSFFATPAPTIASDIQFANGSNGHWFYANATASDVNGGSNITWVSINTTAGSCAQFSNSTSGNNFSAVYNCSATAPSTASVYIIFNDPAGGSVNTANRANAYPDNAPSLTAPNITPSSPALTDTLACNAGTFSDADADTENAGARTWAWYRNDTLLPSQTSSSLALSGYGRTDRFFCIETASNSTWNATATSPHSNTVVIGDSAPVISSDLAFTNATAGHWFYANATASDADGAADIVWVQINATAGSCAQFSNSSAGNNLSVVFNCSASSPSTPYIQITFNDSAGASTSTSNLSNAYLDNPSTLTSPSLSSSSPKFTDLLTCNAGTFSDADADTENTSARTFVWYRNANAVSGQNASTLNLSSYLKGDNISCQETATNTTWHASNASATSANATLVNSLPSVSVSSPVSYALLNSSNATLQISAVANGLSIDQCWYQLDNGATHSISACSSATLLSLSNDVHNLTAYANDTDGNVASALRVFFVDAANVSAVVNSTSTVVSANQTTSS